jgi:hypothetical protein
MGVWDAVGGAISGGVGWVGDRINEVGSMVGGAILGKKVKKKDPRTGKVKRDPRTGKPITQTKGGLIEGIRSAPKIIGDAFTAPAKQYGWIDTSEKVGAEKNGLVLVQKSKDPRTGQTVERWVKKEVVERRQKAYEQSLPTEQDIGWEYAYKHRGDLLLPAKSAIGTLLNLDLGNMFGAYRGSSYHRGLAQYEVYEKKPEKVLTSPAAITAYTIPISYGAGRIFGWGFGQAGGLASKASRVNPVVWTPKTQGLAAVRASQVPLAGAKAGLTVVAATSSAERVAKAGAKQKEIVAIPNTNTRYTIERGGPFGAVTQAGQEGVMWLYGMRGAMKKPMFPVAKQAVYETVYPKYSFTMADKYQAFAKNRAFPSVTAADKGRTIQGKINYLFSHPQTKGYRGPLPLKSPSGQRLVTHGTSQAIFGLSGKKPATMWPLYVTPGEAVSTPFLKMGGGSSPYTMTGIKTSAYNFFFPKPYPFWGKPRVIMSYAKSSKIWPLGKGGYGPRSVGKTPEYNVPVDKYGYLSPTRLVQAQPIKTEIQAIFSGGAEFKPVNPSNLTGAQRFFLPFVGGTPYHYQIPTIFGLSTRVPVSVIEPVPGVQLPKETLGKMGYFIKPHSHKLPTPTVSEFESYPGIIPRYEVMHKVSYAKSSKSIAPSYSFLYSHSPSKSRSLPRSTSPSKSKSPSASVSYAPYVSGTKPYTPTPGQRFDQKRDETIHKYKIPESLDYYNELKEAYKDLFGG